MLVDALGFPQDTLPWGPGPEATGQRHVAVDELRFWYRFSGKIARETWWNRWNKRTVQIDFHLNG